MTYDIIFIVLCFLTSVTAGMGVGGGGILTTYLASAGISQLSAQKAGLSAFVFAGIPAALINAVRYRPDPHMTAFLAFCGCAGCVLGSFAAAVIPQLFLKKLFGIFLCATGLLSVIKALKKKDRKN